MDITLAVIALLASAAYAAWGYYEIKGQHQLAFWCFMIGHALTALGIFLYIGHIANKWHSRRYMRRTTAETPASTSSPQLIRSKHHYSPALRKALARLQSFSDHLPTTDLTEHDVNEYHSILDVIETEIREDLSPFHIPPAKLTRHWAGTTWEGANKGFRNLESAERFCKPDDFRIALSGAITFIDGSLHQIALHPPRVDSKELESKANTQPLQLQTSDNSQTPKPSTYKPDKTAIKVMLYIARSDYGDLVSELSKALNLDHLVIKHALDQLIDQGFVGEDQYAPLRGDNEYCLMPKGTEYLVKNALLKKPTEKDDELDKPIRNVPFPSGESGSAESLRAIERLRAILDNLPKGDVLEKYVDIFHQTLREIENGTGHRLINFCIPPEELKHREIKHPAHRRIGRFDLSRQAYSTFTPERYCDRTVFLIAINSAIASLKH